MPRRVNDTSAIERTLAQYRAALASTLDPLLTIDAFGVIQVVSDSVETVFGWSRDELVGRNISMLMPEPYRSRHDGYLASYRRTGITGILGRTREFEAVRKDGTRFPVEISVSRADVPGGESPIFTGIIRDISERRRREEEVRLLKSLALAVGEATDLFESMRSTLQQICHMTGWSYGEAWLPDPATGNLLETTVWYAEDDRFESFHAATRGVRFGRGEGLPGRVWESGRPEWLADVLTESLFARANAARHVGFNTGVAAPILTGREVVAVVAFFMTERRSEDERLVSLVTAAVAQLGPLIERKRAEDALRESEARLQAILDNSPATVVSLKDTLGRYIMVNARFEESFGVAKRRLFGKTDHAAFGNETAEALSAHDRRVLAEGRAIRIEEELPCREGPRTFLSIKFPLLDVSSAPYAVCSVSTDITERKKAEEVLAQHRIHLEELVVERTAELDASQEQLRLADRLASIGTLAAGLGHDMNNVLLPIRCRLDALDESSLPAEAVEHFRAVRSSAEYLQQLADGLHLLALDPNDESLSAEATNIGHWWSQIGALLSRGLPNGVEFSVSIPRDLPMAGVASHRLTQAILNLVVNAGEAVEKDGRVRLWAEPGADGRTVRVGVTDNGRGMSEEVRRRALDPFFTTKRRGLGTGVGLRLGLSVVQPAGGALSIESELGRGTTVVLEIPVAAGAGHEGAPSEATAELTAQIAVTDDRVGSLIRSLLDAAGFVSCDSDDGARLLIVDSGAGAIARARAFLARGDRQVLVLGGATEEWSDLSGVLFSDPDDFEMLRGRVRDAASLLTGAMT